MKKITFLALALMASFTFYSCKKSSTSSSTTSSQWTIGSTSYKGTFTGFLQTYLNSADNADNAITINFAVKPIANGTYTVLTTLPPTNSTTECSIVISSPNNDGYFSTGKTGDKVTVTVSGGKVTASFSGVEMELLHSNTPTTASGIIIEQ